MKGASGFAPPHVCLVFVSRMSDPGHGDAFVMVAASNADQAAFHLERLVAKDFPRFIGSAWTRPEPVSRLYAAGASRILFAAMPKDSPIIFPDGG